VCRWASRIRRLESRRQRKIRGERISSGEDMDLSQAPVDAHAALKEGRGAQDVLRGSAEFVQAEEECLGL
jgi:hypothetical protein